MRKLFGTDGIRGIANIDLTCDLVYKIGRIATHILLENNRADKTMIVGMDTRISSPMLENAISSAIASMGVNCVKVSYIPTSGISYLIKKHGFMGGVMISASHNPYYDNGIKILDGNGHKMDAGVENLIEQYIDGLIDELPYATKDEIGCALDYSIGRNRYIGYLMSIPTRAFRNYRVGLDCANGASSAIAKSVFDALGAKTYVINSDPDGLNINTNCGSTHIEVLQQYVKENALDIGFAYDGDADRCICVDEFGRVVDGDLILYVCGKYLKDHGELANDTVVTTIMSNLGLYKAFDKEGIKYEKTAVGDKYVNENMVKNGHVLGGEQSGHIIFSKHATTGDGILTSLKVMEAVIESKRTIAQLIEPVTIYPQLMKNVPVRDKKEAQEDPDVRAVIAEVETDLGENGRVLVRESGTEPVVRVMVEADTDEKCLINVNKIVDKMKEKGFVIKR